jgi:hypothetical protein
MQRLVSECRRRPYGVGGKSVVLPPGVNRSTCGRAAAQHALAVDRALVDMTAVRRVSHV